LALFPSVFPTKILYAFLIFRKCGTCRILLHTITLTLLGAKYSYSNYKIIFTSPLFLHISGVQITSSLFGFPPPPVPPMFPLEIPSFRPIQNSI
jgi:hypothetical protein